MLTLLLRTHKLSVITLIILDEDPALYRDENVKQETEDNISDKAK